jgi:hypothetical protein
MGTTANSTTQYGLYKYQSEIVTTEGESGVYYGLNVRANPEILTLIVNSVTNDVPLDADVSALPFYARTSGGKNRFGITTRAVKIKRLVGTDPLKFYIRRTVPWLQNTLQETIDAATPVSIAYQGQNDWILVGVRDEEVGNG